MLKLNANRKPKLDKPQCDYLEWCDLNFVIHLRKCLFMIYIRTINIKIKNTNWVLTIYI